jgi:hypothetical protein
MASSRFIACPCSHAAWYAVSFNVWGAEASHCARVRCTTGQEWVPLVARSRSAAPASLTARSVCPWVMARVAEGVQCPVDAEPLPDLFHPGEALPEHVVCAVKLGFGEGDSAQAEEDQGDEPWEVERAIQRQAFFEEALRCSVVVVDVAGDHPKVMQTCRGNEGVSGRSGQCQAFVQQCRRGLVFLFQPGDEPGGQQRIGRASLIAHRAVERDAFLQ